MCAVRLGSMDTRHGNLVEEFCFLMTCSLTYAVLMHDVLNGSPDLAGSLPAAAVLAGEQLLVLGCMLRWHPACC
jgi:hypothetical protein